MRIEPVEHKFGKPKPYPISFQVYKGSKKTPYGDCIWGEYKGYKIEIYDAKKYNQKLQYVCRKDTLKWVWSKLKYVQDGITRIIRSKSNGM